MNVPLRKFTAGLALMGTASLLAVSGYAQTSGSGTTTKSGSTEEQPVVLEKFVTTGSYLPVAVTATASPQITLENTEIARSGSTDPLQLMRQLTPYFSGNGNLGTELNNGGGGESYVALRNLTTLVLINGYRTIGSPFSNGENVDINQVPVAAIDRIEIVKDGASTVYGSDAIGGVVNIILKKNYNGLEITGRMGSTRNGDYKTRNISALAGVSAGGATLTVIAQHFENTPLLTTDRPLTTMTPAQIAALGYKVTSSVFSGSFAGRVGSDILAGSPLAVGAPGYKASLNTPPAKTNPNAAPQTLDQLEAAGIYIPISSTPVGQAVGSTSILNTTLFGNPLIVNTRRNQFVVNGEKELIGKHLVAFSDFLYTQNVTGGSGLAPAPIAGFGPAGGNALSIPANNPYNLFGVTIGVGAAAGAPAARTRLEDIGKRFSVNETNLWRFVGGFRGEINEKYSWEADYNYVRASLLQQIFGGANGANMNTAMQPLLTNGAYTYNSAGRPLSLLTDANGNNLPVYNPFSVGAFNDAATLNAIRTTLFQSGNTTLRSVSARVKGKPFELPAGDVAFAVGVEARREALEASVDGLFANGLALGYNPADSFAGGSRSTKGAFAELLIPITSPKTNLMGFHKVDLTLGDREEKIEPGGNANTPKVGLRWAPFDDQFILRSTWAKGFIAPSIFDLYGPAGGNSPSFTLPQGNGSSGSGGTIAGTIVIQGTSVELSNPYLKPSNSKSYTAGFVYSPKQVKGLSITVDYYHIEQDKVGSIDYTAIVADLNAKGSGSLYAQDPLKLGTGYLFADGTKLTSTAPNQVNHTNFGQLTVAKDPQGDQWTDGLDFDIAYRLKTGAGLYDFGILGNILFNYKFRATPRDPYLQYARVFTDSTIGGAGANGLLPGYLLKPYVNYSFKNIGASLFMTYIPKTTVPGTLFGSSAVTGNTYTISGRRSSTPSYFRADLTVSYTLPNFGREWLRGTTLTVGANNVFNKMAPYIPGNGSGDAENNTVKGTFDIVGRFYFVELRKAF